MGVIKIFTDVIWDFDGTLFDTYPSMVSAFKRALKDYGIDEKEENILQYMKISQSEARKHYMSIYGLDEKFVEKFNAYEKSTSPESVKPFPYAKEICEYIKNRGKRNFILTHRGNSTLKYLKAYGMENYFEEIITKHSGFKRKPDPEGYIYLLKKYNIDKSNALIVGDRDFEILAGKAANIKVCLYNTNNIDYKEKPEYIINSLNELKNIVF
ncbi:haloacid dehalogenase superfamily, subfamily IA, variant 3 with third motif having DD or ED/haloacid dehalogenase superfamily, subfamily IA, variant 1 with third motif having Dx(3-4)D or Dx(3-4)E [Clostridium sp. USBA 49]|jgi:HAD superfamily hydrolase (TIGR01509 family)|uniref:HAD-IA family hydrolase n=1 Tax=Clostridium sp. USBA 49 TaxID=1881060 RepID=UPI00099A910D|nr:HAD-IA family hydrolase [Clostridium sp. USBA 49]SKA78003.1 haloacid dehalogenase superfamily, subfamily IA, variant 3 with third motif having DD or ED/haloacid dehalogenase superfamily, subfamily IA, variant 1 with third motif having Dx(3-4)D or Dx(3-4)E [Clostridium sp. USBA 49]